METTARLYHCAGCRRQCLVCVSCDRGQRYCAEGCAQEARARTVRAAGARYQQTRSGKFAHAARQRRYRARQQKVTHQGSPVMPSEVSCAASEPTAAKRVAAHCPARMAVILCHFCGRKCSPFVRHGHRRSGAEPMRAVTHATTRRIRPPPSG
jgi:hypothetical protein